VASATAVPAKQDGNDDGAANGGTSNDDGNDASHAFRAAAVAASAAAPIAPFAPRWASSKPEDEGTLIVRRE
jgi:hypothetical protein